MSIFFLYLRLCQELYGFAQGWELGSVAFLSFVDRDTHPTCTRCRGNVCASDRFCDICAFWSATQWELLCRRVLTLRKPSSRPSGSVPSAPPTSPRGNFFGSFASWVFFFFFFPPLRRAGEAGGVSGCTWCFVWGGFLPSRSISVEREGWRCLWTFCLGRAGVLRLLLLLLLRERARLGLPARCRLSIFRASDFVVSPQFSPHVPRRENSRETS